MAPLAEEVNMGIFICRVTMAQAQLIDDGVTSVFYGMNEILLFEEGQHPEYTRFVKCDQLVFKFCQGERVGSIVQCPHHRYPVGGWADAVGGHHPLIFFYPF